MCLAIPKKVLWVKRGHVLLKSPSGRERAGSLVKVKKGDWVLTRNGAVISKISKKNAKEILKILGGG